MLKTTFWNNAANSLPSHVRERYASYFETAERWELLLDAAIEAWSRVKRAIGGLFHTPRHNHQH